MWHYYYSACFFEIFFPSSCTNISGGGDEVSVVSGCLRAWWDYAGWCMRSPGRRQCLWSRAPCHLDQHAGQSSLQASVIRHERVKKRPLWVTWQRRKLTSKILLCEISFFQRFVSWLLGEDLHKVQCWYWHCLLCICKCYNAGIVMARWVEIINKLY